MQKIYLSRAQTRAMAAHEPIGDPFGGVAYGERNDPISAAISIASMMGAAEAGFAAMTLMQGLQFAGAAISLVGNISGDADLMKIGAVAGLAGAAGNAGFFGEGVKNMGSSAASGFDATEGTRALGQTPVSEVTGPATGTIETVGPQATGATTYAPDAAGVAPTAVDTTNAAASGINAGDATGINAMPSDMAAVENATGTTMLDYSMPSPGGAAAAPDMGGAPGIKAPGMGPGAKLLPPPASGGLISDALNFTKTNPTGALMIGKGVEGAMDMATGKTQATVNYYKAKAAEAQRAVDLQKERQARLNQGYMRTNAGVQVNPNAQVAVPSGLINSARGG